MRAIRDTADLRAVSSFILALDSSSEEIRSTAADSLYFTYPGAPGVTEAFIKHQDSSGVHEHAANYLAERFDYIDPNPREPHPWYIAKQLVEKGQLDAAREIYHQQLISEGPEFFHKLFTAKELLKIANETDRVFLVEHLLPDIEDRLTTDKSYLPKAKDMVSIATQLQHPAALPALLKALELSINQNQEAFIEAVFAIKAMGKEAIRQGETVILNRLMANHKGKITSCCHELGFLLALLWLNPDQVQKPYADLYSKTVYEYINSISNVSSAKHEAEFLQNKLYKNSAVHSTVKLWVIQRLKFLKDEQGIPLLIRFLAEDDNHSHQIEIALTAIGGAATKKSMLTLFSHPEERVRKIAINVYAKLAGEDILPFLRKMRVEPEYGDVHSALTYLYYYGTPKDLPYLNKNCDFWRENNDIQYWACHARYGIWDRHHYDLNGPIIKVTGPPKY